MGLKVVRYAGQWVRVGDAMIRVSEVKRKTVTLMIEAPPHIRIEIIKDRTPEDKDHELR